MISEHETMVAQQKIKDDSEVVEAAAASNGSPKSRLAMLKRSSARTKANAANSDPFRFQGSGIDFKGKFIGERDVTEARGDTICAEAMQLAKASVKSSGSHKQRITLNISIDGLKIKDQKTGTIVYNFPVSKISFIARDTTDARAFGFIFSMSSGKYKFYGIKTAQTADHSVLAIRDMFQVVFEMKKKQLQEVKQKQEELQNAENNRREAQADAPSLDCRMDGGVAVADLLDLETELECIEQGCNQLQNVPHMPEDDYNFEVQWNNSNGTTAGTDIFGMSGTDLIVASDTITTMVNGGVNGVPNPMRDPFDVSFVNSVTYMSSIPAAPMPIQPSPFETGHVGGFVAPVTNGFAAPVSNGFAAPVSNGFAAPVSNGFAAPVSNEFAAPQQRPSVVFNGGHFTNGTTVSTTTTKDPFDDSFFNAAATSAPPANAPIIFESHTSSVWSNGTASQRVTTLEEAFSKLVNMDQLVPSTTKKPTMADLGGVRKNPFEHIINPPKMPMNALVTTTSHFH